MIDVAVRGAISLVDVHRLPPPRMTALRIRGFDERVMLALETRLATLLPRQPNHVAGYAPRALWMAPGEYMLVGGDLCADAVSKAASGAAVAHAVEVGEGHIVFAVAGAGARDLIAKGCSIDLHPRSFGVGRCARTLLTQVAVTIEQVAIDPVFHIYADASYAHHLELWFDDALIGVGTRMARA